MNPTTLPCSDQEPTAFTQTCRSIESGSTPLPGTPNAIETPTLCADCRQRGGLYTAPVLHLDLVLRNVDGKFIWGCKHFSDSAKDLVLKENILHAELKDRMGNWQEAHIDLSERLRNNNEKSEVVGMPVVTVVSENPSGNELSEIEEKKALGIIACRTEDMDADETHAHISKESSDIEIPGSASVNVSEDPVSVGAADEASKSRGCELLYADAAANYGVNPFMDGALVFHKASASMKASMFRLAQNKGVTMKLARIDILSISAGASAEVVEFMGRPALPTYIGADAHLNLLEASAAGFSANLGLGVETGFGVKDGTAKVHVAGCGLKIGRKVGISVFGSGFSFDFGSLF